MSLERTAVESHWIPIYFSEHGSALMGAMNELEEEVWELADRFLSDEDEQRLRGRTRDILATSHTINWVTGEVLDGSAIPPAGQVWVTRTEGPEGADIESGLNFRTALANSLNAHALVSIHNNAAPDGPYDGPGSEVYHQYLDDESKRLAGLLVEETRRGFTPFGADWVGAFDAGAKFRVRANGDEVYGILRRSEVPAVIAEGVYISNPSEDALLGTPEFRQAYARNRHRASASRRADGTRFQVTHS